MSLDRDPSRIGGRAGQAQGKMVTEVSWILLIIPACRIMDFIILLNQLFNYARNGLIELWTAVNLLS